MQKSHETSEVMKKVSLEEATSLNFRAKVILDAVDEELVSWMTRNNRQGTPVWEHLGMTPQEYGKFLFDPMAWARGYVVKIHGE